MAAPALARRFGYTYRDARGFTARTSVLIGDADEGTAFADSDTLGGHLQALSNATVTRPTDADRNHTYGGAGQFQNVEDKIAMTFLDSHGYKHVFRFAAPIAAAFLADLMTVNAANAAVANVVTDFQTFVYASRLDTSPLLFVGGVRERGSTRRRINIFTRIPAETGPDE